MKTQKRKKIHIACIISHTRCGRVRGSNRRFAAPSPGHTGLWAGIGQVNPCILERWDEESHVNSMHALPMHALLISFKAPSPSLPLSLSRFFSRSLSLSLSFSLSLSLFLSLSLSRTWSLSFSQERTVYMTAPVNKINTPTAAQHSTSCSAHQYKW